MDFQRLRQLLRSEPWLFAGLSAVVLIALVIGVGAAWARRLVAAREEANAEFLADDLVDAEELRGAIERKSASVRAYVLTGDSAFLATADEADRDARARMARLYGRAATGDADPTLTAIAARAADYEAVVSRAIDSRRRNAGAEELNLFASSEARTKRFELDRLLETFVDVKTSGVKNARGSALRAVRLGNLLDVVVTALALVLFGTVVLLLIRNMRALSDQKRILEEKNRDLDAFAGRISHDLRNVLQPVSYAAAAVRRSAADPAAVQKNAGRIEQMIWRAEALLEGLLAFSRAGASDSKTPGSMKRAVDAALEELAPTIARIDAKIDVAVDDAQLPCSPGLLHLLVLNLAGNAVKFLDGRPLRRVAVRGGRVDDGYELTISDTGPGIPASAVSLIFEPFYRVPGTRVAGTGIGLATVRRIVDAHGGRIAVESREGTGTTFRLFFPRALAAPAVSAALAAS